MAVVKNLMVRAGADFSAITQQSKKASQSMRGMQSSVSRSCNLMTKAVSGVKKVLGAIGVGLSVAAIAKFSKEAAAAYDTQMQGEIKLATVMRKTMGASNAEIQSIMDLTAAEQQLGIVGDEVQLAGAQQLATYLHLSSSLQTLLPVMNDLAVQQYGLNVSEEQAVSIAKLFGKAMEGQTSALTRYGFALTAAQQQVLKYGTETERAATLADIVRSKVGGMNAALASTSSGRMQQLSNAIGDIKEQFGQAVRTVGTVFLPVLNAVGSALAGIATIANKVAQAIASVFGGSVAGREWAWAGVTAGISDTTDAVDDLTDAQGRSAGAAKKQKEALQTASFDTLNILKATDAAGGGGGGGSSGGGGADSPIQETQTAAETAGDSIGWLQQKLEKLKAVWEDFKSKLDFSRLKAAWGELKDAIGSFASSVGQILGAVWKKYLEPLAVWTINKALPATLETVAKVISWVAEKFENLAKLISGDISFKEWLKTLSPVEKAILAIATAIVAVVSALKLFSTVMIGWKAASMLATTAIAAINPTLIAVVAAIAAAIAIGFLLVENWDTISAAAKKFAQGIGDSFAKAKESISTGLQNVANSAMDLGRRIKDAWENIKETVNRGKESVLTGLRNLVDAFRNSDKSILDSFIDLGRRIWDAWTDIKAAFASGKDSISAALKNLIASIKGVAQKIYDGITWPFRKAWEFISGIFKKINSLLSFNSKTSVSSISTSKVSIGWHANGGVFDRPSLIGVGENGKEAVMPLERNTGWISNLATELAAQMAGGVGTMGGEALIEGIHDAVYEAMMAVMGVQRSGDRHQTVLKVNGREFFRATWDDFKAVAKERGVTLVNT